MKHRIVFWISTVVLLPTLLLATESVSLQNQRANGVTVWDTDYINGEWYLIRSNYLDSIPHEINALITAWNKCHITKLSFLKTNADTVYIEVDAGDSFSRLGTTGTERILAEIVFTITEDSRYPNVFLKFDESDHASPGLYCRQYFFDKFLIISFHEQKTFVVTRDSVDLETQKDI